MTENTHSTDGRYRIVRSSEGWKLYDDSVRSPVLITGTETECRELAETIDSFAPDQLYEPLPECGPTGLSGEAASLVRIVNRITTSGARLEVLLTKKVPAEIVALELSILKKWSARLAQKTGSTQAETLL